MLQEGYAYHMKDEYFTLAADDRLLQNKEGGNYRPTYYCMKDPKSNLLWMVPMSTRTEKYQLLHDRMTAKYKECLTIVMGYYDGKRAAFLLQNMFPTIERYLDHVHTKNGNPVPINYLIRKDIEKKMKRLKLLIAKGHRLVFTDIGRLEKLMLAELLAGHNAIEQGEQQ